MRTPPSVCLAVSSVARAGGVVHHGKPVGTLGAKGWHRPSANAEGERSVVSCGAQSATRGGRSRTSCVSGSLAHNGGKEAHALEVERKWAGVVQLDALRGEEVGLKVVVSSVRGVEDPEAGGDGPRHGAAGKQPLLGSGADVSPEVACVGGTADRAARRGEPAPVGRPAAAWALQLPAACPDVSECEQK